MNASPFTLEHRETLKCRSESNITFLTHERSIICTEISADREFMAKPRERYYHPEQGSQTITFYYDQKVVKANDVQSVRKTQ